MHFNKLPVHFCFCMPERADEYVESKICEPIQISALLSVDWTPVCRLEWWHEWYFYNVFTSLHVYALKFCLLFRSTGWESDDQIYVNAIEKLSSWRTPTRINDWKQMLITGRRPPHPRHSTCKSFPQTHLRSAPPLEKAWTDHRVQRDGRISRVPHSNSRTDDGSWHRRSSGGV